MYYIYFDITNWTWGWIAGQNSFAVKHWLEFHLKHTLFILPLKPLNPLCHTVINNSFWVTLSQHLVEKPWAHALEYALTEKNNHLIKLWQNQTVNGILWTHLLFPHNKNPAIISLQLAEKKGDIKKIWPKISQHIIKKNTTLRAESVQLIKSLQQAFIASALILFCYTTEILRPPTIKSFDFIWFILIILIFLKPKPCPHYYYHSQLAFIASRLHSKTPIQQALMESYPLTPQPLLFLEKLTRGLSAGSNLHTIVSTLDNIPPKHRQSLGNSLKQGSLHLDIDRLYDISHNEYLSRLKKRIKVLHSALLMYSVSIILFVVIKGYIPFMKDMMTPVL